MAVKKFPVAIIAIVIAAALILTGVVQLPTIGSVGEPASIKLGANETIVGYTPAGAPIIGEKNQSQVTLPVTVSEVKLSGQNNPEQPPGLPAQSWNWAGRTSSWANVLTKTEPTSFVYGSQKFTLFIPESDQIRMVSSFGELSDAWDAVYGPGMGFKFSDSGSGANGFFTQLLRNGNVEVYQGELDDNGKRDVIVPYPWGSESLTRYTLVDKNQAGKLEKYELKLSDFSNVMYASSVSEPAKEQPAKETGNPAVNPSGTGTSSGTPASAQDVSAGRSAESSSSSNTPASSADVAKGRK